MEGESGSFRRGMWETIITAPNVAFVSVGGHAPVATRSGGLPNGISPLTPTVTRAKVLDRLRLGDAAFRHLTRAAAFGVLVLLSAVIVSLIDGSIPALRTFGFGFLTSERWNPVTDNFGAGKHPEVGYLDIKDLSFKYEILAE